MTRDILPDLPVKNILPGVLSALEATSNLVIIAPPGAGKTTLVPLALIDADWRQGRKIIVLEPRRLAARAAASRMASLLGEAVGQRVGYRVRFDSKVSKDTIIEVVTEGVFTRMLADDPGLEKVATVLFDEFHERSLDGDLVLALCLDLQAGLRDDLRLIPISATIDGAAVADLMDAEVIESEGRSFPVDITHVDRPPAQRIEQLVAHVVRQEISTTQQGSILVFLPGQGEIERTYKLLEEKLTGAVSLHRLYGALSQNEQDAAIAPVKAGDRKVVLSSAIAETSLTIEGITTVIDSGLSRQPVFEPATGLTRLQTVRASQASVNQRAGRAGRLGPGKAIRLWHEGQTAALPKHTIPEILNAGLTSFVLDLAEWGVTDFAQLKWLDQPPEPAVNEARKKLVTIGALSKEHQILPHGKAIRSLPMDPSSANSVLSAAQLSPQAANRAALLSLLLQERGAGGWSVDLSERADRVLQDGSKRSEKLRSMAGSIAKRAHSLATAESGGPPGDHIEDGVLLAFGRTDRIAQKRGQGPDGTVRFRLANGRGAQLDGSDNLATSDYLVVLDMVGRAGAARITSAVPLIKNDLSIYFTNDITRQEKTHFDVKTGAFKTYRSLMLGALELEKPVLVKDLSVDYSMALGDAIREHGLSLLPWQDRVIELRQRLSLLHNHLGDPWPDVSDDALLANLEIWLLPYLEGVTALSQLKVETLQDGLMQLAGYPSNGELVRLVPSHFDAPSGSRVPLSYEKSEQGKVVLGIRPQELFGLDVHPSVLDGKLPLEIELLSPRRTANTNYPGPASLLAWVMARCAGRPARTIPQTPMA